jgi:hypothetical protein
MSHRSWGILLIQHNIKASCTVLDFPARERFIREIRRNRYDVIGISGIVVNVGKARDRISSEARTTSSTFTMTAPRSTA